MVGSGDQLLADIAPLGEGDALQKVQVILKGNLFGQLRTLPQAIGDEVILVEVEIRLLEQTFGEGVLAANHANAQSHSPWVEEGMVDVIASLAVGVVAQFREFAAHGVLLRALKHFVVLDYCFFSTYIA